MRDFDAEKIEEVFSDGLLNVLAAPEFAQSDKVRRVFSALENRAYLGDLVGSIGGAGRVHVFIGRRTRPSRCTRCRSCSRRTASPAARSGVVGVLGPTRMSYRARDRHRELRVGPARRARRPPVCLISFATGDRGVEPLPATTEWKAFMTDHPHQSHRRQRRSPHERRCDRRPDRHVGRTPGRGRDRDRLGRAPQSRGRRPRSSA